jgi:histidine triad (HIT) family protein
MRGEAPHVARVEAAVTETDAHTGREIVGDECIFCSIVAGDAPAHVVWEDDRTLTFMDIAPVVDGHTLIIPKIHCDDLFEADPEDLRAVISLSHRVAHAIGHVLHPDGLGVYQLNGSAAGQTVFHYHMHLIPRNHGEALQMDGRKRGDPESLEEMASRLRAAMEIA